MLSLRRFRIVSPLMMLLVAAVPVRADPPDTTLVEDETKFGITVSATRTERADVDVPGSVVALKGEALRRRNVRTLADALQDVTGIDASGGSDNGSRMPNIGMWGLKEFDALLVCVDGVPVGGPFNPALEQISIDDVDRIELVGGPQGTLYGVSAFAGMIQVFTRTGGSTGFEFTQRVSSFEGKGGDVAWRGVFGNTKVALSGSADQGEGYQDRTDFSRFRSTLALSRPLGKGTSALILTALQDQQAWGTPLPYDNAQLVDGFAIDRNDAVNGATIDHTIFGGTANLRWPFSDATRLEGTLSMTNDRQKYIRSFVDVESIDPSFPDTVDADGARVEPKETTGYVDLRLVHDHELAGKHEFVTGAALTFGKLSATFEEFDMRFQFRPVPIVPGIDQVNVLEGGEVETERSFFGAYLHDSWTPQSRLTIGAGGRVDVTHEDLEGEDEATKTKIKDEREDTDFSGDASVLVRLLPPDMHDRMIVNVYASARRNFKPAAPNVLEPEGLEILEPETSVAYEGGLKVRGFDDQFSLDGSVFQLDFENQVLPDSAGGTVHLVNAGHTRFKGEEVSVRIAPVALRGFAIQGGYAHHDPKFVVFNRPNGGSVNGKQVEMAPRELWNAGASWAGWNRKLSLWAQARGAGERFFNKRNTMVAPSYSEWDAGASLETGPARWSITGRNLSDERFVVGESEIGDAQFYVSAPRRIVGSISIKL